MRNQQRKDGKEIDWRCCFHFRYEVFGKKDEVFLFFWRTHLWNYVILRWSNFYAWAGVRSPYFNHKSTSGLRKGGVLQWGVIHRILVGSSHLLKRFLCKYTSLTIRFFSLFPLFSQKTVILTHVAKKRLWRFRKNFSNFSVLTYVIEHGFCYK